MALFCIGAYPEVRIKLGARAARPHWSRAGGTPAFRVESKQIREDIGDVPLVCAICCKSKSFIKLAGGSKSCSQIFPQRNVENVSNRLRQARIALGVLRGAFS